MCSIDSVPAPHRVHVDAPFAQEVHTVYVRYVDHLCMLRGTPSVKRTTLRASANVPLPLMSSSAWPAAATVFLDALVSVKVFGDTQQYGPDLFCAITAPKASVRLDCDMLAPSNHQAVLDVAALLHSTLDAADADALELLRALKHSRRAFRISGHSALLAQLNNLLANGTPNLSMPETARLVQALSVSMQETVDNPVVSHAEVALRDVLAQIITYIGVHDTEHDADCALKIAGQADSVQYAVTIGNIEGGTHKVTVYMTGPRSFGGWTGRARWERRDSLTWAASRMLTGLAVFNIKEVAIVDNGFDTFESLVQPNGDVEALVSSLAYLSATHTLRFKFYTATTGKGMVEAIEAWNLPSLTSIYVQGASIGGWDGHHSAPSYQVCFDALEAALKRRKDAGYQVVLLVIEGHFCLYQFWIYRVRVLVVDLQMDVTCTRGVGEVCVFCRTLDSEFWP